MRISNMRVIKYRDGKDLTTSKIGTSALIVVDEDITGSLLGVPIIDRILNTLDSRLDYIINHLDVDEVTIHIVSTYKNDITVNICADNYDTLEFIGDSFTGYEIMYTLSRYLPGCTYKKVKKK